MMARRKSRESLDDILKDKQDEFESGLDRKEDEDLDDLIWDLGGYENDAPLDERSEFERELPAVEEDLTDELDETGERIKQDTSSVDEPDVSLLRIEISGEEMEVVCGQIPNSLKKKLLRECDIEEVALADIWYDHDKMKRIAVNGWTAWYTVDEFYHEIGLTGKNMESFSVSGFLNGESIEDFDLENIATQKTDTDPKPGLKKNFSVIVAGTLNDGRFIYEQDIKGEFDIGKLAFVFTDLKRLGIPELLLTEVLYDGEPMYYEHEVMHLKDMLDVSILEFGKRSRAR
jgi:hypothetical protein